MLHTLLLHMLRLYILLLLSPAVRCRGQLALMIMTFALPFRIFFYLVSPDETWAARSCAPALLPTDWQNEKILLSLPGGSRNAKGRREVNGLKFS